MHRSARPWHRTTGLAALLLAAGLGWPAAGSLPLPAPLPAPEVWAFYEPDDPLFAASQEWGDAFARLPAAWDRVREANLVVAVIDTGIGPHVDLNPNVDYALGKDFVLESAVRAPTDWNGHGTHVAGILAAALDNATGVAGALNVTLMPVRVLGAGGSGSWLHTARGIRYACQNGAHVVNLSLGGLTFNQTVLEAVEECRERGVLLVAAAGNSGVPGAAFPAAYPGVLGVGAVDGAGRRPLWSNFGAAVDLYAPGASILSTCIPGRPTTPGPEPYCLLDGTSMATPYVAGVAAMVRAQHAAWSADEVAAHLVATARPSSNLLCSAPCPLLDADAATR